MVPDRATKSVGHEEAYARDLTTAAEVHREVVRLADAVAARLRSSSLAGRTVTVKVRFHDHATITRSRTEADGMDTGPELARVVAGLLEAVDPSSGVRLLGVSVSALAREPAQQLRLAEDRDSGWTEAWRAVDEVRTRYGDDALVPATLLGREGVRVKRRGDQQWGPAKGRDGGS